MKWVKGFIMSLGMFSTFPVPKNNWDDERMPLVIPCFPVVGALIGAAWFGLSELLLFLKLPTALIMALAGIAPFLLSGCLHLDGWMDTADAVLSRRNLEERRRILKDPHVGVFAVVAFGFLALIHFCAFYTLVSEGKAMVGLVGICAVSRAAVGIILLKGKPFSENGYMAMFQRDAKPLHTAWLIGVIALALVLTVIFSRTAALALGVTLAAVFFMKAYLQKQLEGLNGDLCGAILTFSELCGLVCLAMV